MTEGGTCVAAHSSPQPELIATSRSDISSQPENTRNVQSLELAATTAPKQARISRIEVKAPLRTVWRSAARSRSLALNTFSFGCPTPGETILAMIVSLFCAVAGNGTQRPMADEVIVSARGRCSSLPGGRASGRGSSQTRSGTTRPWLKLAISGSVATSGGRVMSTRNQSRVPSRRNSGGGAVSDG